MEKNAFSSVYLGPTDWKIDLYLYTIEHSLLYGRNVYLKEATSYYVFIHTGELQAARGKLPSKQFFKKHVWKKKVWLYDKSINDSWNFVFSFDRNNGRQFWIEKPIERLENNHETTIFDNIGTKRPAYFTVFDGAMHTTF